MTISYTTKAEQSRFPAMHRERRPRDTTAGTAFKWNHIHAKSLQGQTLICPGARSQRSGASSNAEAIAQLGKVGALYLYPGRASVFHQGDAPESLYLVQKGKLKLSIFTRKGRLMIIRFAVAGDLLGLSAILNQSDHEFLAETLEPSILVSVPRSSFLQLFDVSDEVNSFATQALARDHKEMLRGIRRLAISGSVRERMAQLILDCLELFRANCHQTSVRMNWTYGELADMVNSSRETVTRIMRQFEREELIARRGSLIIILDEARMKRLAS